MSATPPKPTSSNNGSKREQALASAPGKTLYRAELSDPRERAAQPRALVRGRAARRAETTSDITRFRGLLPATLAGAVAASAAALLFPPPGGHSAPGPLSLPHAQAGLACGSCHVDQLPAASRDARTVGLPLEQVCTGCHGAHGSIRGGHRQLLASGALTCASCHPIHRSDQGVVFDPVKPPVRFAPGVEIELATTAFRPGRAATVAIVTAGSCARCHDLESAHDPIARCLVTSQTSLGDARPVTCFDEHRSTFPNPDDGGVCRAQHTEDRALSWDAAREVAAAMPLVPAAMIAAAAPSRALLWIGVGIAAAAFVFAGVRRGREEVDRRRKMKAAASAPAVMLRPPTRVRLPQIDVTTCLGCYACVDACPYDVLTIEKYVAVVARPEACCGLTLCEQRCPNGSLTITDGATIDDRPRLDDHLASLDTPGLYLAGDVTGLPLIKNAIHQGVHAVTHIAESLKGAGAREPGVLDLLIVGAGPAGISAALRAKELGLSFAVIEQGSVAQSIQSFPRGKVVFDQPLDLPVTGALWLKESTKEELLSHWLRIVRKEQLPIHEGTRMVSVDAHDRDGNRTAGFVVATEPREGGERAEHRARRVLLAIGQRGSPRRLPFELPAEVEAKVYYHLADARSLAGKRVLIVGLGDVAMEAAIALSRQPETAVTVAYRGSGFQRGKKRNIDEIRRLAASSRLSLLLDTEVTALTALDPRGADAATATLSSPSGTRALPCDAVLVLIGSIPPWNVLRQAGVRPTVEPTDRSGLNAVLLDAVTTAGGP